MSTILVTGPRGAGKSTALRRLASRFGAERNGPGFYGVMTTTDRDATDTNRTIWARTLPDGEVFLLASTVADRQRIVAGRAGGATDEVGALSTPGDPVIRLGPFLFSQSAIDRANSVLTAAPGVVGVLDEAGPLELNRSEGFRPGLDSILKSRDTIIVVVRPNLVERMEQLARGFRGSNETHLVRISSPKDVPEALEQMRELVRGVLR